jgi:hypothetical protein
LDLQQQFARSARCAGLALHLSPSGNTLAASWPEAAQDDFTLASEWFVQRRASVVATQPIGSVENIETDVGFGPYWDAADNAYFSLPNRLQKYSFESGSLRGEQIQYVQSDPRTFVNYDIDQLPTTIDRHVYFLSGIFHRNIVAIPIGGGDAEVLHRGNARNRQWVLSSSGGVVAAAESVETPAARGPSRADSPTEVSLIPDHNGARVRLAPFERFRFFPPIPFDPQRDERILAFSNRGRAYPALVTLNLRSGREQVLAAARSGLSAAAVSRDGRHWYWVVSEDPLPVYRSSAEAPAPLRRLIEEDRFRAVSLVDQSLDGGVWLLRTYSLAAGVEYRTFDARTGETARLPTVCDGLTSPVELTIDEVRLSGGYAIRSLYYRPRREGPDRPLIVYLPGGPFEPRSYAPSTLVSSLLEEGFPVVALHYPQRARFEAHPVDLTELVEQSGALVARAIARHAPRERAPIVVGESFGAWLGLRLMERNADAGQLIGVSSAFSLDDMRRAPEFSADRQGDVPWSAEERALELNEWPSGATAVFIHGGRDQKISVGAARFGVESLQRRGLGAELILRRRMLHDRLAPGDWDVVLAEIAERAQSSADARPH